MSKKLAVVTGASGFVGKALSKRLLSDGFDVIGIARRIVPELSTAGVKWAQVDLSQDSLRLAEHFRGAEVVFHVAANVSMWGPYEDFYRANVRATEQIIRGCQEARVPFLVFTSSPSVVAKGTNLRGVDEREPYPDKYDAYYPQTKAEAEKLVMNANGKEGLSTVALRPHLIFGPGDTNLLPTIVAKARAGKLIQIGDGKNLSDFTYIDDCVEAHMAAYRALASGKGAGMAYFISQGDPLPLWQFINSVLVGVGLPQVTRKIPKVWAFLLAVVCEGAAKILPSVKEPLLTRFLVEEMATDHYFDISAARRDLGFNPSCTVQVGLEKAILSMLQDGRFNDNVPK